MTFDDYKVSSSSDLVVSFSGISLPISQSCTPPCPASLSLPLLHATQQYRYNVRASSYMLISLRGLDDGKARPGDLEAKVGVSILGVPLRRNLFGVDSAMFISRKYLL